MIIKVNLGGPSFLYAVSNWNDLSPEGTVFSLEKPRAPELVADVHTGLRHLRAATVVGEDSHWVVLGGTRGGGIKVYERVEKRALVARGHESARGRLGATHCLFVVARGTKNLGISVREMTV